MARHYLKSLKTVPSLFALPPQQVEPYRALLVMPAERKMQRARCHGWRRSGAVFDRHDFRCACAGVQRVLQTVANAS
jgi:hypothetical protein